MLAPVRTEIIYPSRDGKRMADNTLQYRWITAIESALQALFRNDPNVFVAADLLWYPAEGFDKISVAPDVMVAFGRPKSDRTSYLQWQEDDIAPQVVFEILSDSNDHWEMRNKQDFYEDHGVEEYYEYDPLKKQFYGCFRDGGFFRRIPRSGSWTSPLLKVRFEMRPDLQLFRPDGTRFLSYLELEEDRDRERQRAEQAESELQEALNLLKEKGIVLDLPGKG